MPTDEVTAAPDEVTDAAVEAFRVLGHQRRLTVMQLFLHVDDTLCGCEIADILGLADYQVSRDLSALRKAGLVTSKDRSGTWIHYQLPAEPSPTVAALLTLLEDLPVDTQVAARLQLRLAFREQAGCVLGVGDPEVLAALDQVSDDRLLTVID